MAVLGVSTAFFTLVLYRFVAPHAEYCIDAVSPESSTVRLLMRPVGRRGIDFEAGQFAFIA